MERLKGTSGIGRVAKLLHTLGGAVSTKTSPVFILLLVFFRYTVKYTVDESQKMVLFFPKKQKYKRELPLAS